MTTEERDVPDLPTLLNEIQQMQGRFDVSVAKAQSDPAELAKASVAFVQNDMLPWLKDFVESTWYGIEDLIDKVNPVEITGAEADEISTLLQAALQTNPQLAERITPLLGALDTGGDDEDADGEEDEES